MIVKLIFNENQLPLDNLGQHASIFLGNAAQTPVIQQMSTNYIELSTSLTPLLGQGQSIYENPETAARGDMVIDFQQAILAGNNDSLLSFILSQAGKRNYGWVRVSLSYQEGDITFTTPNSNSYHTRRLTTFVGYNKYITDFNFNGTTISTNNDKSQGHWAFEVLGITSKYQAPEGATTVYNPIFATSMVPQGLCVVTGEFNNDLVTTDEKMQDITVSLSFSINNSFESTEVNTDSKYAPSAGEQVLDIALRR